MGTRKVLSRRFYSAGTETATLHCARHIANAIELKWAYTRTRYDPAGGRSANQRFELLVE